MVSVEEPSRDDGAGVSLREELRNDQPLRAELSSEADGLRMMPPSLMVVAVGIRRLSVVEESSESRDRPPMSRALETSSSAEVMMTVLVEDSVSESCMVDVLLSSGVRMTPDSTPRVLVASVALAAEADGVPPVWLVVPKSTGMEG